MCVIVKTVRINRRSKSCKCSNALIVASIILYGKQGIRILLELDTKSNSTVVRLAVSPLQSR
jgi:hypothetical protein